MISDHVFIECSQVSQQWWRELKCSLFWNIPHELVFVLHDVCDVIAPFPIISFLLHVFGAGGLVKLLSNELTVDLFRIWVLPVILSGKTFGWEFRARFVGLLKLQILVCCRSCHESSLFECRIHGICWS